MRTVMSIHKSLTHYQLKPDHKVYEFIYTRKKPHPRIHRLIRLDTHDAFLE